MDVVEELELELRTGLYLLLELEGMDYTRGFSGECSRAVVFRV